MYTANEIDLYLNRVYAAQRQSPTALEASFQPLTYGTNLLPHQCIRANGADCGALIAGQREERPQTSRLIGGRFEHWLGRLRVSESMVACRPSGQTTTTKTS